MPSWLQRQLKEAYQRKDLKRVRLLNQCWFYYRDTIPHSSGDNDSAYQKR